MKKIKLGNGAATNSILLTFVSLVTTCLGIIVTKLLSVSFSLEEYGTYSQALLIASTTTSICLLGLSNATNYFFNKTSDEGEQRKYLATIFAIEYIAGVLCGLAVICFRFSIASYFGNDKIANLTFLVAFTPLLTNLIAMFQTLFVSIKKAKLIAVRNFVVSFIRLIAVIFACFSTKNIYTVLVVILLLDIGQVVYFAYLFSRYKSPIRIKEASISLVPIIFKFSIPLSVYAITCTLIRDIDKYVIGAFANTETLAVYTNAAKILPFDMLTASFITVLIPIITRMIGNKQFEEAQNVFKLYLRIGYTATFIFVGGAIALSKNVMLFLYDEKYLKGLPVFVVYLIIDMIRFANVTTILTAAGKTKIIMIISSITLGLNAIFNVIAFQLLGIIGPAVTTLFLTILMTIALLHYGAKEINTRKRQLFDFKEVFLVLIEIGLIGFVEYFISRYLSIMGIPNIVILIVCYGSYLVLLLGLNYKRLKGCLKQLNEYK